MAGWIKMPLITVVGLVQSEIVLDGTQLSQPRGAQQPSPCHSTELKLSLTIVQSGTVPVRHSCNHAPIAIALIDV